ncbi:UNKNOWN [Stylonychia lemnae]|uniref:Uncharacterized protein n=1 Tax=Stylonychia lemnae TaxID=5949 RepID=A0A077ZNR9_STYLE|nr:UNKNOWN [Stylonychia lemnae]|eukprot:CDW71612.1 UNKNOWN [Stylonychia lemnae]
MKRADIFNDIETIDDATNINSQINHSEQTKQNQTNKSFTSSRYNFRQILSPQQENQVLANHVKDLHHQKADLIKAFENLNQFSCQQSIVQNNSVNQNPFKGQNDLSMQYNLESKYLKEQKSSGLQTPNDLEQTDTTQLAHVISQVNQQQKQSNDQQQLNLFAQSIDKHPIPFNLHEQSTQQNANQDCQQDLVQMGSVLIHQDTHKIGAQNQQQLESYNSMLKITNNSSNQQSLQQNIHPRNRQHENREFSNQHIQVYQDPKRESIHHNDSITEKIKVLRDDIQVLFPSSKTLKRNETSSTTRTYNQHQQNIPIKDLINRNKDEQIMQPVTFLAKSRSQERDNLYSQNILNSRMNNYQQYKVNAPDQSQLIFENTQDDLMSTQQFRSRSKELLKSEKQQQNMISLTARIEENKQRNQSILDKNSRKKSSSGAIIASKNKLKFVKTSGNLKLNNQLDRMVNIEKQGIIPTIHDNKPPYDSNDIQFLKDEILQLSELLQKEQHNFKKFKESYQRKAQRESEKYQKEVSQLKTELNQIEAKYLEEVKRIEQRYKEYKLHKAKRYQEKLQDLTTKIDLKLLKEKQYSKQLEDQLNSMKESEIGKWDQNQIDRFKDEYDKKLQIIMEKYEMIIKELRQDKKNQSNDQYEMLKYQNSRLEKENANLVRQLKELKIEETTLKDSTKQYQFNSNRNINVIEPQSFVEFDSKTDRRQTINSRSMLSQAGNSRSANRIIGGEQSEKQICKNTQRRLVFEEIQNQMPLQEKQSKSRNLNIRGGILTQVSQKELKMKYGGGNVSRENK